MAHVRFDRGPTRAGALFAAPHRVITAQDAGEVDRAFDEMEAARRDGFWLAGLAAYELGYALVEGYVGRIPAPGPAALMQFGVFDGPAPAPVLREGPARLTGLAPGWGAQDYAAAFARIHDHIVAGDIYQANLTFPMRARLEGTPEALYARLAAHQPVPHGALVDLGGPVVLSRSPELFFAVDAVGRLETRPMKGTAPRGADAAADAAARQALAASTKDQAENLMIVDLLRNDMSRVSLVGSVKVPALFEVETYATLHQMTSHVTSQLVPGTGLRDLFGALFPCGSITGAPKIRAMEILSGIEPAPRGAYCGSIGWIAPDGAMEFNVAIRTLTCTDGQVSFGVGGGVVYDSTARGEYEEALLKAGFAAFGPPAAT